MDSTAEGEKKTTRKEPKICCEILYYKRLLSVHTIPQASSAVGVVAPCGKI